MTRRLYANRLVGLIGGAFLALALFYALALLVAPPVNDAPPPEPLSVSTVEAPEEAPTTDASASEALPTPPAPPPPPPKAEPMPAPQVQSPIAIPDVKAPLPPTPELTLDDSLPPLDVQRPPKPTPKPEPAPTPVAKASAQPAPKAAASQSAAKPSKAKPAPAAQSGSPRPTVRTAPEYPSRARRRGIEGFVEVAFVIRPDGHVDGNSLKVVRAEPSGTFDRAALKAIARWEFPTAGTARQARQRLEFQLR
ncbi:energy transducer TonB [Cobetia sp. L2A1]|uniref:energy transducer TonB n=1 Tax=Cobetia sp. L2A1 TaxID=2686360 RepID=UPI00131E4679|nr:energy transducer TonB [Cobetia sp. L2A1]